MTCLRHLASVTLLLCLRAVATAISSDSRVFRAAVGDEQRCLCNVPAVRAPMDIIKAPAQSAMKTFQAAAIVLLSFRPDADHNVQSAYNHPSLLSYLDELSPRLSIRWITAFDQNPIDCITNTQVITCFEHSKTDSCNARTPAGSIVYHTSALLPQGYAALQACSMPLHTERYHMGLPSQSTICVSFFDTEIVVIVPFFGTTQARLEPREEIGLPAVA